MEAQVSIQPTQFSATGLALKNIQDSSELGPKTLDGAPQLLHFGGKVVDYVRAGIRQVGDFFATYPAVLSGYIIYAYLFVSIIRLFLKVKYGGATLSDAYDIFSALPFMWLLAVAMVKVIEIRSQLHRMETENMRHQEELRLKETQLRTMKEVVKGLQHRINNPLAVIFLYLAKLKGKFVHDPGTHDELDKIEFASTRISNALAQFSQAPKYEVEYVGHTVGAMAVPDKKMASMACL